MKKLFSALMLFISITACAQFTEHVVATRTANWNGSSWVFNDVQKTDMYVVYDGNYIKITDMAHSHYYTYKITQEDNETVTYAALDEKARECNFIMHLKKNIITIMYSDFLISYLTKN